MDLYIGVKRIKAVPMNRKEYNDHRGWGVPEDENPDDEGFLVEYVDGGKSNHPAHEGYISWSPREVFIKAYRPVEGMDFGTAIQLLKSGFKVARQGWNGKGMWLALSPGAKGLPAEKFWSPQNRDYAEENGPTDILPCITMKTATGEILMGWLASQTDILADDWVIVE